MQVEFRDVDGSNWRAVIQLKVRDDQTGFVASNMKSLVQSQFDDELKGKVKTQGIYDDETLVGFIMYGQDDDDPDDETGTLWIIRFMIGADFQGKGYGRAGMQHLINIARQQPETQRVRLSYVPDNAGAQKLYAICGFVEEGIHEEWGEMVAVLQL